MKTQKCISIALAALLTAASLLPQTADSFFKTDIISAEETTDATVEEKEIGFSLPSGYYDSEMKVELASKSGRTIVYTTDGSDPTKSSTAQVYSAPVTVTDRTNEPNIWSLYEENENSDQSISRQTGYKKPTYNVEKVTVIRAAVKNTDGSFGKVESETYIIKSGVLKQFEDIMVVSLVTDPDNLFSPDTGIYVTGKQYLEWRNSPSFNARKSAWDTDNISNFFSKGKEWEREATFSVFRNGEEVVHQNVGIRIKGASTRNTPQKSFNIYAKSKYGPAKLEYPLIDENTKISGKLIDKYDSVCLRAVGEDTRLRDGFASKLLSGRESLTTQDMQKCVVFLNGEYWGLYEMTEKFSDYFIQSNYKIEKENVAMIKNGEHEEGPDEETESFINFADTYAKKDLTNEENYKAVCDFIDIDSMIDHYAAGIYLCTYDWPNHNSGAWRNIGPEIEGNPYSDGKWRFMSFDFDYSMGATYENFGGVEGYAYDSFRHMENMDNAKDEAPTNLFVALMKNKDFQKKFINVYCDLANEVLTPEKANAMADKYQQEYTEHIANSTVRWWGYFGGSKDSNLSYNREQYTGKTLPQMKTFFRERAKYTLEDMEQYLGIKEKAQTITLKSGNGGKIRINTITTDSSNGWTGSYYPEAPVTLTALPDEGHAFTGWSGDISGSDTTVTVTLKQAMSIEASFGEKKSTEGDINTDGAFDSHDILALQKYLLTGDETDIKDRNAADADGNGKINISDLISLKSKLL